MHYFAMGDSNMAGADVNPNNFFNILAKNLNIKFDCSAKFGASNDHIIRMTKDWINNSPGAPDTKFVFIGWSTWEREEHLIDNVYYDIDAWSINHVHYPANILPSIEKLKNRISDDPAYMSYCGRSWAEKIYQFSQWLDKRNIGFLFWNSYMNLPEVAKFPFDHRYILPYNEYFNQYHWLKRVRNCATLLSDPYHFDRKGHELWANFLTTWIKDWEIIKQ